MIETNKIPENNYTNRSTQNEKSFFWYLKKIIEEFCRTTPLHGYKFIFLKRASRIEKFFWSTISIAAIFITLYIVYLIFMEEIGYNPTTTFCGSTNHLVNGFNFPTMSVCNFNKMSKTKVNEITQQIINAGSFDKNQTIEVMTDLRYIYNLIYANYDEQDKDVYTRLEQYMSLIEKSPIELVYYLAPSCQELLVFCQWKMKGVRCSSMFQQSITPEGVCCTANNFAFRNFTFTGYRAERYKYKPLISATCGSGMGLNLVLNINPEDYFLSEFQSEGVKILFNDPYNYIEWGSESVVVSANRLSVINIIPYGVDSHSSIFELNPTTRGCAGNEEIKSDIFSTYTKTNCLNECRMTIIMNNCSCIPLYYINKDVILEDSRPCDLSDIPCLSKMKEVYMSSVPGFHESTINTTDHKWGEETSLCDCLPNCEFDAYLLRKTEMYSLNTSVYISYRYLYGTIYVTEITMYWSALFGIIGGLVTLTLGFSPLAGLTFIYYFVIKLCFYKKQENNLQDEEADTKTIQNSDISNQLRKPTHNKNPTIKQITLTHYHSYDKQYSLRYLD